MGKTHRLIARFMQREWLWNFPKWEVPIKSLPSELREIQKMCQKECKRQRGWRTPRKQDLLNQQEQSFKEFTDTEAEYTGSSQVCTGSSDFMLWLPVWCFYGSPECVNEMVSDSYAFSWTVFLLLVCLVQHQCGSLCLKSEWMNEWKPSNEGKG